MRRNRTAAWLMCLLLIAAILAGCNTENDTPPETEGPLPTESVEQTEATEETAPPEEEVITEPVNPGVITISTKYGNLYYQDQWMEYMRTEQSSDDTSVIVAFEAEINGVRYPLFHITIGQGEGDAVGQITDASGAKHDVFVHMEEVAASSELTAGEQNRLYAMQEEINYIIENLE